MVTLPRSLPPITWLSVPPSVFLLSSAEMHPRQHTVLTQPRQTNFISHRQGALCGPPEAAAGSPW